MASVSVFTQPTTLWYVHYILTLFQSRELEIGIYWKDYRNMCAVKFLRLEDFLDDLQHGMVIHLEPQGILFAEVGFCVNVLLFES